MNLTLLAFILSLHICLLYPRKTDNVVIYLLLLSKTVIISKKMTIIFTMELQNIGFMSFHVLFCAAVIGKLLKIYWKIWINSYWKIWINSYDQTGSIILIIILTFNDAGELITVAEHQEMLSSTESNETRLNHVFKPSYTRSSIQHLVTSQSPAEPDPRVTQRQRKLLCQ